MFTRPGISLNHIPFLMMIFPSYFHHIPSLNHIPSYPTISPLYSHYPIGIPLDHRSGPGLPPRAVPLHLCDEKRKTAGKGTDVHKIEYEKQIIPQWMQTNWTPGNIEDIYIYIWIYIYIYLDIYIYIYTPFSKPLPTNLPFVGIILCSGTNNRIHKTTFAPMLASVTIVCPYLLVKTNHTKIKHVSGPKTCRFPTWHSWTAKQ